ncbi:MAG: hypothetical protein BWY76_01613 [bacterium ADurb.Bin429]|nr:MAG: hypothetical protein BWY76_01613 [bacterium ADurb.Bin429]
MVIRILQALVGITIIGMGIFTQSWWGLFGLMPLWAAVTGSCGCCGDSCALSQPKDEQPSDKSA